ncbi:glycosyltransferase [Meiothermus sp. QL-1]|uniref:glycosyltransferase n=1 Tax=Meiothermus sp. QL-1 TaxID=2058095 RepID=UPI000E0C9A42|nr:glycosyltransferase [Meiothermus sp. QL-1]RDI96143.1 glycosyltransferase [Meiothermus sp. QL-1]
MPNQNTVESREKVCAIVVTHNREDLLRTCLESIYRQNRLPDKVLVVENACKDETGKVLERFFPEVTRIALAKNEGSAGGFYHGLNKAYEMGFDWYWVADDDCVAEPDTLATLLEVARTNKLDAVAPLLVDISTPNLLCFPLPTSKGLAYTVAELETLDLVPNQLHLWNGILISKKVVEVIGLPNPVLFIRGDENDYFMRMKRSRYLRFGTTTNCRVFHPGGLSEQHPMIGKRLIAVHTKSPLKNFYTYRNRGYLIRTYGGVNIPLLVLLELARYSLLFLLKKRNVKEWKFWISAALLGFRKNLISYEDWLKKKVN